ncbi:Uncharacterised protein [Chlamydia trachomatis]|nr:Uncharacterised protein [Chlamydia trachomatis]CRH47690.1 Uncharacterised protein [Chlamydia trachomatis]CRH55108.1 Uncharacterised protein [Chlamydia trachomatis]
MAWAITDALDSNFSAFENSGVFVSVKSKLYSSESRIPSLFPKVETSQPNQTGSLALICSIITFFITSISTFTIVKGTPPTMLLHNGA